MFMRAVRFTQSARRHKIGRAHALYVISTYPPTATTSPLGVAAKRWQGVDDRGVMLEIVAVEVPDYLLVIHVMPMYRGGTP